MNLVCLYFDFSYVCIWNMVCTSLLHYANLLREAFNKKNIKSCGSFHNWSDPPPSLWKKNIFSTRDFRQVKFIALKCRESPHLAKTLKVFQFQFSISKQKPFKSTSCHSILPPPSSFHTLKWHVNHLLWAPGGFYLN